MWIFYAGLLLFLLSGVVLVWKVRAEYKSQKTLSAPTVVAVWAWYILHAAQKRPACCSFSSPALSSFRRRC